jgi:hypothetical protein
MNAADARALVRELEVEADVAKLVTDAPPLSDELRTRVAALFAAPSPKVFRQPAE